MDTRPDILCIGAALWDIVGRSPRDMRVGSDVPGRISRLPGGVALNIAMTLVRFGLRPALLSAIGRDVDGDALIDDATRRGIVAGHVHRPDTDPTDLYMAIEGANGLIAAIADAHTLEAAGDRILAPLADGTLGTAASPWTGPVALDGNLTTTLLAEIASSPLFAAADLRVAPASPGKADRLACLISRPNATLYVNLEEAGTLTGAHHASSQDAAAALVAQGAARVLVTDGARSATLATASGALTREPPRVVQARVTGAGDTFMAAHIAAEIGGATPHDALERALGAAALYVSGVDPT